MVNSAFAGKNSLFYRKAFILVLLFPFSIERKGWGLKTGSVVPIFGTPFSPFSPLETHRARG
jgi:hypothetical protein